MATEIANDGEGQKADANTGQQTAEVQKAEAQKVEALPPPPQDPQKTLNPKINAFSDGRPQEKR
jgi:hypothetical protein